MPVHGARATMRPYSSPTPVVSRSDVAPQTARAEVSTRPASASITTPALRTSSPPMRASTPTTERSSLSELCATAASATTSDPSRLTLQTITASRRTARC
jgi:hypothetical protein